MLILLNTLQKVI